MATNGRSSAARQAAVARLSTAKASAAVVAAALGLYLVAFLLLSIAALYRLGRPHPPEVTLDPLPPVEGAEVEVRGRTRPLSLLEVGVDDRVRSLTIAGSDGEFQFSATVSPAAQRIWVRALTTEGDELGRAESKVSWKEGVLAPGVDLCLVAPDRALIWVAGRGTPSETLSVEPPLETKGTVEVDQYGIVDLLVPFHGVPPAQIVLRATKPPRVAAGPCRVLAAGEPFPLARKSTVTEGSEIGPALEKLKATPARDRETATRSFLVDTVPRAQVEVRLPARHPYYRALTAGQLPPVAFLESTLGSVDGLLDSDEMARVWSELGPDAGEVPAALEPETRVWLQGDTGIVEVRLRLFALLWSSAELRFGPGSGQGMASQPLLTERDRFQIGLRRSDRWAFDLSPTALDPAAATWSGPLAFKELAASRSLPPEMVAALRFADRESDAARPATKGEALRRIDASVDGSARWNPGLGLWKALLTLVPIAAVVWLLRRRQPYSSLPGAPWLLALTLAVAVVLAWPPATQLTADLLRRVPGLAFERAMVDVRSRFEASRALVAETERLRSLTASAGWLVLVTLVGAVPLYFSGLAEKLAMAASNAEGEAPRRRRAWRLALRAPLVLYAAAVLAILCVAFSPSAMDGTADPGWARQLLSRPPHWLPEHLSAGVVPLLLVASLLVCAGLRGIVFTLVFAAAAAVVTSPTELVEGPLGRWVGVAAVAAAGLAALPLLARLLAAAVPVRWPRLGRPGAALALTAACLALPWIPPRAVLAGAAGLLGLGLIWAVAAAYGGLAPTRDLGERLRDTRWTSALLFFAVGIGLGWPIAGPDGRLAPAEVASLVQHWTTLLPYLLAVGLALLVMERIGIANRRVLVREELAAGAILYAAFLVSPTTTWLLLPVPLLVAAALARHWLFAPDARRSALLALEAEPNTDSRDLVRTFLDGERLRTRAEAATRALDKELESAKVSPSDYDERRRQYEALAARGSSGSSQRPAPFALGDADFAASVGAFLRVGLLLASGPILISLYEYLPVSSVNYPFPVADFFTFLIAAILKWGLYAIFFGLFFANLRGETGLTKGLHFFVAVAAPFTVYRLLGGPSPEELRSFLFWLTQLFVFFGLLGLLAADLRLLNLAGSRGTELRTVHRLPALYAFLSTAAAAIVPTVLAVVAGKLGEVVGFFMQLVAGTGASP